MTHDIYGADSPTDAGALDCDSHFTRRQLGPILHIFELRLCLANPKIVARVGPDTNIGLGWANLGSGAAHSGGFAGMQGCNRLTQ